MRGDLKSGKDLLLTSIGALADEDFYENIKKFVRKRRTMIHLPSGAIGGLDVLESG